MGLTTRPPGDGPGTGLTEPPAPAARELRALVAEIRALAAASARSLPAWPATQGAAPEPALARWIRSALESGGVTPAALRGLVEAAAARLAASGSPAGPAPLDAARDALLRWVAAATPEPAQARGGAIAAPRSQAGTAPMTMLVAQIANAVSEAVGRAVALAPPPVASGDPGRDAQALAGWLRSEAARAGAPAVRMATAVETGAGRALEAAARAGADPAGLATIETARALIARELAAGEGPSATPPLLYRPDVAPRTAAAAPRTRAAGGHERVLPVGEEERAPFRDPRSAADPGGPAGGSAEPRAEHPTLGPMQCIRRMVEALVAGDVRAFTAQWVYPACFWIDGGWRGCADETALAEFEARLRRRRRERGVVAGRILLLRVDPAGEDVALVHALLSEERIDGGAAREIEVLYTTVRTTDGWRVAAALAK